MQELALIVNLTGYVRDTIYIMKDTIEREVDISKKIDSRQAGKEAGKT
jgi:hypothetical protein